MAVLQDRVQVRLALEQQIIEARPVWKPMQQQPVFGKLHLCGKRGESTEAKASPGKTGNP
ncbi:hypothetical protein ACERK3_16855 [Phycisphaerales bacterium AB-hyl4]|uniref:Uncharacterized protein n=1 Tax=Natronomicrosphaera hydrolytica TaxID=3242702 RepID=A0ABV4U8L1_9BACT